MSDLLTQTRMYINRTFKDLQCTQAPDRLSYMVLEHRRDPQKEKWRTEALSRNHALAYHQRKRLLERRRYCCQRCSLHTSYVARSCCGLWKRRVEGASRGCRLV